MHEERFELGAETAHAVNEAKNTSRRVIAVGQTTVRVLESIAAENNGKLQCLQRVGRNIFIYPPFPISNRGALLTNFISLLHAIDAGQRILPRRVNTRTRKCFLSAYAEAIRKRYRFSATAMRC